MKISSIFLLIIGLNGCPLFGQVSTNATTKITDSTYFDLDVLNNSDQKLSKTLHLNIIATYSKTNGSEELEVFFENTSHKKSFKLKYPLVFSEMSGQFNANRKILDFKPDSMFFSNRSLLLVYYWLNNFNKDKNEAPLSGILHVKPFVKVYKDVNEDQKEINPEADEWMQQMNGITEQIKLVEDRMSRNNNKKLIENLFKEQNKVQDSLNVFKILNEFKDYLVKNMKNKDFIVEIKLQLKKFPINLQPIVLKYAINIIKNKKIEDKIKLEIKNENFGTRDSVMRKDIESLPWAVIKQISKLEVKKISDSISHFKNKFDVLGKEIEKHRNIITGDSLSKVKLYLDLAMVKNKLYHNNYHTVSDVNLQFERGFLEKVQVVLTSPNQQAMIFENYYALGFTSPSNFRNIFHTPLYFRTDRFSDRANYRIYLGDVLSNYFNELDNYTRDYSPADTTVKHIDPRKTPLVYLHRARRVDLVDTKIYTDLLGLADKNPNGVLQTEISKRLNIFTYRNPLQFKTNIGFVNYIDLEGSVSKFEQKERILTLRNEQFFANQQLLSPSYATALDFMRYQTIGLGAAVNAFVFDVPEWKSTFTLDGGFRYIRIPVADSIRQLVSGKYTATINSDVPAANMITWFPKLKLELFSERRYGFYCAWMFNYTNIYTNNQYKYVASYEKSDLKNLAIEKSAHFSNTIEFFARFEPNPSDASGKLFFRTRITFQKGDMNTNFNQIQVGYAYNIVYKK